MFRRKGLFWYHQNKPLRYFDWSSVIDSSVYGFHHPTLGRKIKNNYKRQFVISIDSNALLKSKFRIIHNRQPALSSYSFFLLEDLVVSDLFKPKEILAEELELQTDPLLNSIALRAKHTNPNTLITDSYIVFNQSIENKISLIKDGMILYTNRLFPNVLYNQNYFRQSLALNSFSSIIVGGHHPFGINGQKLVITRDEELINKINSNNFHLPNEWHLAVYQEGIKNIFDKALMPRTQKRANLFEQETESLSKLLTSLVDDLRNKKLVKNDTDEIKFLFPELPLLQKESLPHLLGKISITGTLAKKIIEVMRNYPKELSIFRGNRLFIPDHTLNYQISKNGIELFVHLPFDYAEHHFKNKNKSLVSKLADTLH